MFFSNKIKVIDFGLFRGYTEMHCHVLPGVDDGVQDIEESLRILQKMQEVGVAEVWFTPHTMEDYPNNAEGLRKVFEELKHRIEDDSLQLHLSSEYMLDMNFEQMLTSGAELLPHKDNQLLVETSYFNPPYDLYGMLEEVRQKGYFPLLAHPERYVYMDEDDYKKLKDLGIRFQLNLPSLTGHYGETAKKKAQYLIKKNWYDTCGMDTHSEQSFRSFLQHKIARKHLSYCQSQLLSNFQLPYQDSNPD